MTSVLRSRLTVTSALLPSWIGLVVVMDAFGILWMVTVDGVPMTRYASDVATFTVIEPAWAVLLVSVGMVTVLVVPVDIWMVSVVSVPKSPVHEYSRLTAVSTTRDRVTVAVTFWPSVTSVWSGAMDTARSRVEAVPGVENALSPSELVADTCTWYSVVTLRLVMVAALVVLDWVFQSGAPVFLYRRL